MRTKFINMIFAFVSLHAADPWTRSDTAWEVATETSLAVDWAQTRYIAAHPSRFVETNKMLGKHPSTGQVNGYFIGCMILHPIVAAVLPQPFRKTFQIMELSHELQNDRRNYSLGIRFRF